MALYFATNKGVDKDGALFCLNLNRFLKQTYSDSVLDNCDDSEFNSWDIFKRTIVEQNNRDGIYYFNPKHENNRYEKQAGVFLYPGNLETNFEDLLKKKYNLNEIEKTYEKGIWDELTSGFNYREDLLMIKIKIPLQIKGEICNWLIERRNIRYYTLFPDAEGLIQGLTVDLPFSDNIWPKTKTFDPFEI